MTDERLTPEERAALDALPREIHPDAALEDRVTGELRRAGAFAPARRSRTHLWRAVAAVIIFLAGFASARLPWGTTADGAPQFLLLLYGGEAASPADVAARVAEYGAWARAEDDAGRLVLAEKLDDVRLLLGPGAAAPADREPSGFFLIRALTLDAARAAAATNPHLRYGGTIVVRPIDRGR
jgi:hypothetical protein